MPEPLEVIEVELTPIPPDTVSSVKEELIPLIEATLREAGKEDLLSPEYIQIEVEKTFPTDAAIIVILTLLTSMALETYKELILPAWKRRYEVKQRLKDKNKKMTGKRVISESRR